MNRRKVLLLALLLLISPFSVHAERGTLPSGAVEETVDMASPLALQPDDSSSLVFDPRKEIPEEDRTIIAQVLDEHRKAGGETLKLAILPLPQEPRDTAKTAERLFSTWQEDPALLKEREVLIVIYSGLNHPEIVYSHDLEHLFENDAKEEIHYALREALSKGLGQAAASAVAHLLKLLSSPLLDQGKMPRNLQRLLIARPQAPAEGLTWILVLIGVASLLGFSYLLSYQEIHLSGNGAHRIRPHEQLKILLNAARAHFSSRARKPSRPAFTGEW